MRSNQTIKCLDTVANFSIEVAVKFFSSLTLVLVCLSITARAQTPLEPCTDALISYEYPTVEVVASASAEYVFRLDPADLDEDDGRTLTGLILKWNGTTYSMEGKFEHDDGYPRIVLVSDSGFVVMLGTRFYVAADEDRLVVYDSKGDLVSRLDSSGEDYVKLSEGSDCRLRKPWICYSYPPEMVGDAIEVLDLFGNFVTIDLPSGSVRKRLADVGCEYTKDPRDRKHRQ